MVAKATAIERLEGGDIFFYRPRIGAHQVHGRTDVQRFYMVLAAKWPLAAHSEEFEDELGIRIDAEDETPSTAEICRELRLRCERDNVTPLVQGSFPEHEEMR